MLSVLATAPAAAIPLGILSSRLRSRTPNSACRLTPKTKRRCLIARVRYLAGQDQLQQDEQGTILVSDEARSQLEGSVQAWDDYIALDPAEPDTNVGRLVVLSFVHLNDAAGAAEVQKVLVAAEQTSRGYSELARYLYFDGQMNQGDKAAAEAVASAEKADRAGIRSQLKGIADQARKQQRVQDGSPSETGSPTGDTGY